MNNSTVILTLGGNPVQTIRLTNGPINWTKFKNHLDNTINWNIPLKTHNNIERVATLFEKSIQQSANISSYPNTNNLLMQRINYLKTLNN